ncbi:unnamed protein product [Somion occarium]|uniref:Uncharacterized protein n=1 Tax=Somion occarium TaxID=3059160 RepID=A0ABP1CET8_9APHY
MGDFWCFGNVVYSLLPGVVIKGYEDSSAVIEYSHTPDLQGNDDPMSREKLICIFLKIKHILNTGSSLLSKPIEVGMRWVGGRKILQRIADGSPSIRSKVQNLAGNVAPTSYGIVPTTMGSPVSSSSDVFLRATLTLSSTS